MVVEILFLTNPRSRRPASYIKSYGRLKLAFHFESRSNLGDASEYKTQALRPHWKIKRGPWAKRLRLKTKCGPSTKAPRLKPHACPSKALRSNTQILSQGAVSEEKRWPSANGHRLKPHVSLSKSARSNMQAQPRGRIWRQNSRPTPAFHGQMHNPLF